MFEDKLLTCKDCGKDFIFSVHEQEFFAEKGLEHAPSRCQVVIQAQKYPVHGLFNLELRLYKRQPQLL